jgi:hypothetical protein
LIDHGGVNSKLKYTGIFLVDAAYELFCFPIMHRLGGVSLARRKVFLALAGKQRILPPAVEES